ncbi:AMP-dependent synthetase/ligase, partial [Treponema sp.]|uniref:AMP-dependent synthetase/ligase n=1 Tax=Treponema sp. TaxID=166 RepID=UPI003F0ABF7D
MQTAIKIPWDFLAKYKDSHFSGEWPTVPEMFFITAERFPERPCFTDFEGAGGSKNTLSYSQVKEKIISLATWLSENGVKKGDRIAVSGKNSPEWGLAFVASLACGAVVCPLDYALHEDELVNLLNTAKPKFLFVDEEKFQTFSSKKNEFPVCSLSPKFSESYIYNLQPKNKNTALDFHSASENDTAAILFTSGTTGIPKGVMLSHRNLVSDAYIAQTRMDIFPTDVFYALLPIHHAYTLQAVLIESLSTGAEIVFGKSMAVSRLMRELHEGQITILLGVPLLFNKLLSGIMKGIKEKGPLVNAVIHIMMGISYMIKKVFKVNPGKILFKPILQKANIHSLRIAICGGGPLAPSIFRIYNEMGIDFVQGYGLTETSPIITLNPVKKFKIESVGQYFFPYMEMKILEPSSDGIGEIAVKGPMVFQGYYNMKAETEQVFTDDGFFKTGDLGKIDSDGYLILAGRIKNIIVTEGGKNVYPEEIENAFQLFTDISQITVRGYISDKATKSEQIEALVYASDDLFARLGINRQESPLDESVKTEVEKIVSKVNKELQPYARISKLTMLEEPLEMTTTQKVKRGKITEKLDAKN